MWEEIFGIVMGICLSFSSAAFAVDEDAIIITAEEIETMNAHKMADVLNHIPGVSAGDSSVGIRGIYKVLVFVDGRPINDPTSGHGTINWDMVTPDEVERIEVYRGKGGLKYGQDASGGVILVTTKKISRLTGNVKTYGGSEGTGYVHTNLQMKAGNWGFGATGGFESTDGYKTNNDKERWKAGGKVVYSLEKRNSISFTADYLNDDRGLSGLPDFPTPFSRKSARNTSLSLQAIFEPVSSTTFYNEGFNHNTDKSRGLDQKFRVTEMGENLTSLYEFGKWGESNYGAEYLFGKASGSDFEDQEEETFSLFEVHTMSWFDDKLSASAGLRVNFNSAFDDGYNPEVKATYKQSDWSLTAVYNRSNNTPSFRQRYNQTSSTRPNPDLDMETSDNYSLAFFYKPFETLNGSISLFYNKLTDRITYVVGDDGIGQYQNFGEVTYKGGDVALNWSPADPVDVKATYTYLDATDEDTGLVLTAKAKHKARLDLYWRPVRSASIILTGEYTSKVYRNRSNTITVPEYTLVDLRAEYDLGRFLLFGEIENLFDKTYYYADGLLGPPLTWIVGINWRI